MKLFRTFLKKHNWEDKGYNRQVCKKCKMIRYIINGNKASEDKS